MVVLKTTRDGRRSPVSRLVVSLLLAALIAPGRAVDGGSGEARADTPPFNEYEVKAVCLLNFTKFVEWPETAFPAVDTPLLIGVLGDDPFGASLEQAIKGETVNGHAIVIKRAHKTDDLRTCHLVFISKSEKPRLPRILTDLKDASVLTVGEHEQFLRLGGVINFTVVQNKVRFEISANNAAPHGLKISSKLLNLGQGARGPG